MARMGYITDRNCCIVISPPCHYIYKHRVTYDVISYLLLVVNILPFCSYFVHIWDCSSKKKKKRAAWTC